MQKAALGYRSSTWGRSEKCHNRSSEKEIINSFCQSQYLRAPKQILNDRRRGKIGTREKKMDKTGGEKSKGTKTGCMEGGHYWKSSDQKGPLLVGVIQSRMQALMSDMGE